MESAIENTMLPVNAETRFDDLYTAIRSFEQRVYTDAEVNALPYVSARHRHCKEWEVRKASAKRLIKYIAKKNKPLNILEVGCGNGWLAAMLAGLPGSKVVGLDINRTEIEQARRVFKKPNLAFVFDELAGETIGHTSFDIIVFAAVLPYFPSLTSILTIALGKLKPGGEIHILDTHFYQPAGAVTAKQRCEQYYLNMGFPEMSSRYYHHTADELLSFKPKVLFNHLSFWNRRFKKAPFNWISVSN